jgi:hypothetical protein
MSCPVCRIIEKFAGYKLQDARVFDLGNFDDSPTYSYLEAYELYSPLIHIEQRLEELWILQILGEISSFSVTRISFTYQRFLLK